MLFKGGICHQTQQNAVHCHLLLSTPSWWADADLGTFEISENPCRSGWPAWSGVRSSSCGTWAWRSTSATCGTSSTSSPTPSTSPPSASGYVLITMWVAWFKPASHLWMSCFCGALTTFMPHLLLGKSRERNEGPTFWRTSHLFLIKNPFQMC